MNEGYRKLFYVGMARYLDLDPGEVDEVLADVGLSTDDNPVAECRDAVWARFPERFQPARWREQGLYLPPTLTAPATESCVLGYETS